MAYATKYYLEHWTGKGIPVYVQLQKDGFVGTPERLKFLSQGLKIDFKLGDWETKVATLIAKLDILNDSSSWYHLEDLMHLESKDFKILIDASYGNKNIKLFDGWINSAPVSQRYLQKSVINLTASNYIQNMDKLTPPILNSADASSGDAISLIDLIDGALQLTGKTDDIMVNCTLEPSAGAIGSTKTLYNTSAANPWVFFANNNEKTSGLKLIGDILTPMNSYLYWWDGNWYVERYRDLFPLDGNKAYKKYSSGTSYEYSNTATSVPLFEASINLPISSIDGSIIFTGSSQTKTSTPGIEFLEIDLDESPVLNLTYNDFTDIQRNSLGPYDHFPPYRKWCGSSFTGNPATGWRFPGYTVNGILDTSMGYSFEPTYQIKWTDDSSSVGLYATGPGKPFGGIQNSILRWGIPVYYVSGTYSTQNKNRAGITTRFKITITNEESKINIKWKFNPMAMNGGSAVWDYRCYYTIRVPEPTSNNHFLHYVEADDYWEKVQSAIFTEYSNRIAVSGGDINEDGYIQMSVDVPVGDVSGWIASGDREVIFSILGEDIKKPEESDYRGAPSYTNGFVMLAAYGDVFITGEDGKSPQDNKIIAQINNKVYDSISTSFKIYDSQSLMVDNGLQTGTSYGTRTNLWNESGETTYRSLVEWYIYDRMTLYSSSRMKLKGSIKYPGYLKPLSAWWDNFDPSTRKYILSEYSYNVFDDLYNCTWIEYDDTTIINLNDGELGDNAVRPAGRDSRTPTNPAYDPEVPRTIGDKVISISTPRTR